MNLQAIQSALAAEKLDGWLFFDHHHRDPLAYRVLGLSDDAHASRRWYYLIPAQGEPRKLVHRIEQRQLDTLPGGLATYSRWSEQHAHLRELLRGANRVAMQYSPDCAIPTLSLVDSGTVDLIRSLGVDVVSSANLIQQFEATWTEQQIESHFRARNAVDRIRHEAFHLIAHKHRDGVAVTECDVRDFILDQFRRESMITDHGPIVAANAHASDPHFEPSRDRDTEIRRGDFVLIDVWAKLNEPNAVYYDITWTGVCSSTIPSDIQNVFTIVTGARDAAVSFLQSEIRKGNPLAGYQVDDISRGFIDRAGFADKFVHRTGHSIGTDVHGAGANIDNFETHDERRLIPNTCFSIEPGIYLDDFGIRSEVNVLIRASEAEVTGEIQRELVSIV